MNIDLPVKLSKTFR